MVPDTCPPTQPTPTLSTHFNNLSISPNLPPDSPSPCPAPLLANPLRKGQPHQLALLPLDPQHPFLHRALHHEPPHRRLPLLPEPVHPIHSLILDRGRPPAIRQNHLARGHEVQPHRTYRQRGEQDRAIRVVVQGSKGGVALRGFQGAVDPGDVCGCGEGGPEAGLDDVEEGGPLAEDDGFGARVFLGGGRQDGEEGFDFGGGCVLVHVFPTSGGGGRGLAQLDGGGDQVGVLEGLGPAHRAAMLRLDHLLDALLPERVRAVGDDRVVQRFQADGAVLVGFDAELQHRLQGRLILRGQVHGLLVLERGEDAGDALAAEFPVVAHLSEAEQDFE